MKLNEWSKREVERASTTWGTTVPVYSKTMFDFLIKDCRSWLDLGCGFGRFLNYLTNSFEEPDYIGYDGSPDMIAKISESFPDYSSRVFVRDIEHTIIHVQDAILCSAVLIHINKESQLKVLKNIYESRPKRIAFDINSPEESILGTRPYFEKQIKGAEHAFRMTWQSHYVFTRLILSMFPDYHLRTEYFTINKTRKKVIYLLSKEGV